MKLKNSIFYIVIIANLGIFSKLIAQESFMPTEMIAEPGETKTNNLSTGTSESLRMGSSSSFGATVNVSSSTGFVPEAESSVKALSGSSFTSNFGGDKDNARTISIDVESLRDSGIGNVTDDDFISTSNQRNVAGGEATITGVFAESTLEIDPDGQITSVKITASNSEDAYSNNQLETANSGAGQNLTNSLNVDITTTEFKNAFSQAF